jgi:KDO2-lipid IV(A) lauroyltransferase
MKKIKWLFEAVFIVIFLLPLAILPLRISQKAGEYFGFLIFRLWKKRREVAIENIRKTILTESLQVSEPPEIIARRHFKNLGISLSEISKIYFGFGNGIIEKVRILGVENYKNSLAKNKGVLFFTGHCGNWELLSLAFGLKVSNISSVARVQNNPYLNQLIEKVRAKYGNRVIYKKGALKALLSELKDNKTVGILIDQAVLPEEGVIIDFMGMKAWTTKVPSLIARRTSSPVMPAFISRGIDGSHTINLYPEVALSKNENQEEALIEDTKTFSYYIEEYIRQHPAEWLWIHRRWKRAE